MKKLLLLLALISSSILCGNAQKPVLKFNNDGKFKIVQFTDVHFKPGNPKSNIALERINEVLDNEKPNFVIFTGDVAFDKPADEAMRTVTELVVKRNIPFGVTFGNHDNEQGMTNTQLLDLLKTFPGNMTDSVAGVNGASNYILPIMSSDGKKIVELLYCLDSHSYSKIKGIEGYDYIKNDQVNWYRENSTRYTQQNGGNPIPALAFFHIPLPEYSQAVKDESRLMVGTRKEKACCPALNSGLYTAMKEMGDVQGVFVGHDHDNDYAVALNGILLAYGRYTGGDTVYNNLPNGARVIELTEDKPGFDTWIVTKGGTISNKVNFPVDFPK